MQNALKEQSSIEYRGRLKKDSPTTDNRIITMAKNDSFLPKPFLQRLVTLFYPERYTEDYIVPIYLEK